MSRMLTDPYQAPSFHDVFSSFPEEIQLTNKFTIIHTDATKELSYGKYTIFVSNDIIHRNRKCKKRTQEAPSYDFKYRYSDFSLCPDCWQDTDKLKYPLGVNIAFVTSAPTDAAAFELLKMMEVPFEE